MLQHPLEIFASSNGQQQMSVLLPRTTSPPPANLTAPINSSLDLQSAYAFNNLQAFLVESSSASSSPPSSGNQQQQQPPHEMMIYTSPFQPSPHSSPFLPPLSSPLVCTNEAIPPMYVAPAQPSAMMAPLNTSGTHHPLMGPPLTRNASDLQSNRSQSLTLLPTCASGTHSVGHFVTSSTPPPAFPSSTPAVDLNSLLLGTTTAAAATSGMVPPAYTTHFTHTPTTDNNGSNGSAPTAPNNSSSPMIINNLFYSTAFNSTDRGSPRNFPKPPLPPSVQPYLKEKRHRQQQQIKVLPGESQTR